MENFNIELVKQIRFYNEIDFFCAFERYIKYITMGIELKYNAEDYDESINFNGVVYSSRENALKDIFEELDKMNDFFMACNHDGKAVSIENEIKKSLDNFNNEEKERYIFLLLRSFARYDNFCSSGGTECLSKIMKSEIVDVTSIDIIERHLLWAGVIVSGFAMLLDILLLERGINLLWYQEMSGIYLIENRNKRDYIEYLGSEKLVQRYIDEALPKLEPQQTPEPTNTKPQQNKLPNELNTDEALKYFAKAKEIGLIDDNYTWLKGKQLLACFCREMSFKLELGKGGRISWQPFEILFKTKKGSLRSNLNDIQKTGEAPTDIYLVDKVFK